MPPWLSVLWWWGVFAGTHLVLSSRSVRRVLIARLSDRGFQGLYSLVALATFFALGWSYWNHRHTGPLLWNLVAVPGVHGLAIVLSGLAWMLVVLALFQPSPASLAPGATSHARGVLRITRHPLFVGLGLWGLVHAVVNGFLTDVIFFGGFLVFWLVGGAHQDSRKRSSGSDALQTFYAETSPLPFGAIIAGRNRLVLSEIPLAGVAVGVAIAVGLYLSHGWLFRP